MSQKKKIAVAYLFAVPIALAIVFYQHVALNGVKSSTTEAGAAANVIQETDEVLALLRAAQTNAQAYLASSGGSAEIAAYRDSVSNLHKVLQRIGEQTKDEQSVQASFTNMSELVAKQTSLLNQAVSAGKGKAALSSRAGTGQLSQELISGIVKDRTAINAVQRTRLQGQGEATQHNLHRASMATIFGGGVLIWLIGVAAFLLFHQERTRVWAGVERRVHTKILQILPVGISVATDTGVILYTNPAEETLLGCNSGELLGKDATLLHDLEGPKSEPTVKAILARLDVGETWAGDLPLRRKDGTIHNIPSWVMNLEFPGKVYRLFVHRSG
jgi:PAS domain S-box-containing protein